MVEIAEGIQRRLTASGESDARVESSGAHQTGWSGVMRNAPETDDAMAWFELFAADWSRGASGTVIGGPRSTQRPHDPGPALSAFVRYTTTDLRLLDHNTRSKSWAVPEKLSRYLAEQTVAWAYLRGCGQYLRRRDWWISPVGEEVASALAHAMSGFTSADFMYAQQRPFRHRGAGFADQGTAVYQYSDPALEWQQRLAKVREVLTWTPPHTDIGLIRYARTGSTRWMQATWPYVRESAVRYNTPLLAMLTPDAHGIQLLTDAHLERAHNLSGWTTTSLNGGRHLVESKDLDAWYCSPEPEPGVLAAARADFGEMIMTPENILANQVWPEGDGDRNKAKPPTT